MSSYSNLIAVPRRVRELRMDGKIYAEEWSGAACLCDFVNAGNRPAANPTEARVLWDDLNLYFAVRSPFPIWNNKALRSEATSAGETLWQDDTVEIFLCPDPDLPERFYQFAFNSRGTRYEGAEGQAEPFRADWQVKNHVDSEDGVWDAEVCIPLRALGASIDSGTRWRLNVCRGWSRDIEEMADERPTSWCPVSGEFRNGAAFALCLFTDRAAVPRVKWPSWHSEADAVRFVVPVSIPDGAPRELALRLTAHRLGESGPLLDQQTEVVLAAGEEQDVDLSAPVGFQQAVETVVTLEVADRATAREVYLSRSLPATLKPPLSTMLQVDPLSRDLLISVDAKALGDLPDHVAFDVTVKYVESEEIVTALLLKPLGPEREAHEVVDISGLGAGFYVLTVAVKDAAGNVVKRTDLPLELPPLPSWAHPAEPVPVDATHRIFADEFLIESRRNLARRIHQPVREPGNPLVVADRAWETLGTENLVFPATHYIPEEKKFKMWYVASNQAAARGRIKGLRIPMKESSFVCYAESEDGLHWAKPELGQKDFRGLVNNNIVLTHNGSHVDSLSVIYRPDHPNPAERYQLVVFQGTWPYRADKIKEMGFHYDIEPGHYAFYSPDGICWEPYEVNPVVPLAKAMDRSNFGYQKRRGKYVGYIKWSHNREPYGKKRSRRYIESDDLVHWTEPRTLLHPDALDPVDTEFYGMFGFDAGDLYLGYLEIFHTRSDTFTWQLVSSRDGKHWRRAAQRRSFFAHGEPETWDGAVVFIPNSPPVEVGDELWIYYSGTARTHGSREVTIPRHIGLARLRRDGFVSLEAGAKEGVLTTVPLTLKGETLWVNAEASSGSVTVEVCDRDGKPLPGFERDKCVRATGNQVHQKIGWVSRQGLPLDRVVKLKFYVRSARLYSFWMESH